MADKKFGNNSMAQGRLPGAAHRPRGVPAIPVRPKRPAPPPKQPPPPPDAA